MYANVSDTYVQINCKIFGYCHFSCIKAGHCKWGNRYWFLLGQWVVSPASTSGQMVCIGQEKFIMFIKISCNLNTSIQCSTCVIIMNVYILVENCLCGRRVWRYQRGNQNLYIEEEQTTKDQVTRTPLKTRGWTQVLRRGMQFLLH